jgi:hypothetical protein
VASRRARRRETRVDVVRDVVVRARDGRDAGRERDGDVEGEGEGEGEG